MRSSAGADGGASRDRRQRSNDAGRHGEECRLLARCDSSSLPCLSDLPGPVSGLRWSPPDSEHRSSIDLPSSTNRRPGSPVCRGLGALYANVARRAKNFIWTKVQEKDRLHFSRFARGAARKVGTPKRPCDGEREHRDRRTFTVQDLRHPHAFRRASTNAWCRCMIESSMGA